MKRTGRWIRGCCHPCDACQPWELSPRSGHPFLVGAPFFYFSTHFVANQWVALSVLNAGHIQQNKPKDSVRKMRFALHVRFLSAYLHKRQDAAWLLSAGGAILGGLLLAKGFNLEDAEIET